MIRFLSFFHIDKKLMVWKYKPDPFTTSAGHALRALTGHSQTIQDLSLSSNGKFGLTGSWGRFLICHNVNVRMNIFHVPAFSTDKTLRLWDLEAGVTLRTFIGHTKDVFSVALSPDNRQIVSGSRDRTIKLWNTMAECKYTIEEDKHNDWVSCVRFSPSEHETLIVSCGWDKVVKVWDLGSCILKTNLVGHTSALHTVTISPDGSLCASGGKDGVAMLWDVNEGKHLYSLPANSTINSLCFSPCNYWLCAATDNSVKIWNLEDKEILAELTCPTAAEGDLIGSKKRRSRGSGIPWCTSLTWSSDGQTLFVGSSEGRIYCYEIRS